MNIGVDVRPLIYPNTGNANFLFYLLKEVIRLSNKNWKWKLFSHKPIYEGFLDILKDNTEIIIQTSRIQRIGPIWLHLFLPKKLKKHKIDVFWSTLFLLPYDFKKRISIPCLLNIHDLNAWVFPNTMKTWESKYLKAFTRNSLKNADEILCLSNTTRDLILKFFSLDLQNFQNKLKVIYPGIIEPPKIRKKPLSLTISKENFFLAVGTIEPRKNFEVLMKAYIEAQKKFPYLPPLIIAGKPGWKLTPLLQKLCNQELKSNHIYFLNSPKIEELYWLYENCSVFFYPSIYEGFGLQILEASYFKKIQIVSNISIFKEIGKHLEGIYYVEDPLNLQQWEEKILMFSNPRNIKLYGKSIKNKNIFSVFNYTESAKKIIEILQKYDKI
ncbi:MAG: glycosyltransferase family 4 protein [Leptonema sp. (in: bacteria)]